METPNIKEKIKDLLSRLSEEDKDTILTFLFESQVLEYGIRRALVELPTAEVIDEEEIKNKPLGVLISEMEKSKDIYLLDLVELAKSFNQLRRQIIHHLIESDLDATDLIDQIHRKILLSKEIQERIDRVLNYLHNDVMNLGIGYGSIF